MTEVQIVDSVREASRLTGISPDTLRDQLTNGRRPGRRDDRGRWTRIELRPEEIQPADLTGADPPPHPADRHDGPAALRIAELEAENRALHDEIAWLRDTVAREQQIRMAATRALPAPTDEPEPPRRRPFWPWSR